MIKIFYKIIFLLLSLICIFQSLSAQVGVYPVSVNSNVIVGGTVYLGDFTNPMATANRLRFTLTLMDPVETQRSVYFRVSIVEGGNIIATTIPGFVGPQFTLERNQPLSINGEDLAAYLNINNLTGLAGNNSGGVLKEGVNEICLEVIDVFRNEPISRKVCASGYWAKLQAPILILPVDQQFILEGQLNSLTFTWQMTDPLAHLPGVELRYLFELREYIQGLNPQDQFENHPLIYSSEEMDFSVLYTELSSPLSAGKSYIWRVTARFYNQNFQLIPSYFVNNGISRISMFSVIQPIDPGGGSTSGLCACAGPDCLPNAIMPLPRANPLSVNETIKYGAFDLTIQSLTGQNSGTGSIDIPFTGKSVEVTFTQLDVNESNQSFSGLIEVNVNSILSGIQETTDGALAFTGTPPDQSWLSSVNAHLNQAANAVSLPLSLRSHLAPLGFNLPFDVLVTKIYFSPTGAATLNIMMLIPDGTGGFYSFGASGIRAGKSGFDLDGLKLYLMQDSHLPGLNNIPVVLNRAVNNDPNLGTYVAFNCAGLEQFNLQASYTFDQGQLSRADESADPVVASMILSSTSWGNFLGTFVMDPFTLPAAEGWKFSLENGIVDFDQTRNHPDIVFPENYPSSDNNWRGFFLSSLSVELPESLELNTSGELAFSTHNLIIDPNGVSCLLQGVNILDLNTGNAGGWGFAIDTIRLRIILNQFIDAEIKGAIRAGIIDAEIDYAGLILKNDQTGYGMDITPSGSFEIPFVKLNVSVDPGSAIYIKRPSAGAAFRPYADLNLTVNLMIGEQEFESLGMGSLVGDLKGALGLSSFDFGISDLSFTGFKINHPNLPQGRYIGLDAVDGGNVNIPGLGAISLSEVNLLEQMSDFNGVELPGIGLDFGMDMGLFGFGVSAWGKQNLFSAGNLPSYSFGKLELRLPDVRALGFKCRCTEPPLNGIESLVSYCDDPQFGSSAPATIAVGDRIEVGHFTMRVEEVIGNTGEGKIEIPFLAKLMEISFSGVTVHTMPDGKKRMISGSVLSKASSLLPQAIQNLATADAPQVGPLDLGALPLSDQFMGEINNLATNAAGFFSLPFSFKDKIEVFLGSPLPDDFDFVILGLRFDPMKARASGLMTVRVSQDQYLKFGISGLNVRPDGINLDGIQIYLAEDFSFGF